MDIKFNSTLKLSLIVSMGGFLFGFDASVISGVISFIVPEFNLNEWQQGFVVSAPTLAAVFIGIHFGRISDWVGRKKILITIAFLYAISAISSALAPSFTVLVIARAIGGAAFGSLVLAPMYIAEISPAKTRGTMVSVNQLNIMIGFSVAYFANYILLKFSDSGIELASFLGADEYAWRWMLGLESFPALIYFLLLFIVPESPRWLVLEDRIDEARNVLLKLFPKDEVENELNTIVKNIRACKAHQNPGVKKLFKPELRLALTIAIIVGIAQQITGINAVYFYSPTIFEQSGVGTDAAFAQAVWIGITNLVFTIIAMMLIDKLGRKPLLVGGLAGVLISMLLAAYSFNQATYKLTNENIYVLSDELKTSRITEIINVKFDNDLDYKNTLKEILGDKVLAANESALIQAGIKINATVVLIAILGFVASFAISLGPVMWVLFAEIFPNVIRGLAISVVGFINSATSFLVQFLFPWELANLGSSLTFMIYGLFALIGLLFVITYLPETKGKSLEQLEIDLAQR